MLFLKIQRAMFAVRHSYLFLHRGVVGTLPSRYFMNMHSHILLCSGLTLPHPTAPGNLIF